MFAAKPGLLGHQEWEVLKNAACCSVMLRKRWKLYINHLSCRQHIQLEAILSAQQLSSMEFWRWNHPSIGHRLYGPASHMTCHCLLNVFLAWFSDCHSDWWYSGFAPRSSQAKGIWRATKVCCRCVWTACCICSQLWNVLISCGKISNSSLGDVWLQREKYCTILKKKKNGRFGSTLPGMWGMSYRKHNEISSELQLGLAAKGGYWCQRCYIALPRDSWTMLT